MKSSLPILLLAGLVLAGCSQKSADPAAKLVNSVNGMRADEVMVARQTSVAVLGARMHQEKDPGMQAVASQMDQLRKGLNSRLTLLASAGPAPQAAKSQSMNAVGPQVLQQQLDANFSSLLTIVAAARTSVDGIGTHGYVAGLPSESFRAGIRTSLDRIAVVVTRISHESGETAIKDIQALQQRITPVSRIKTADDMTAPVVRAHVGLLRRSRK